MNRVGAALHQRHGSRRARKTQHRTPQARCGVCGIARPRRQRGFDDHHDIAQRSHYLIALGKVLRSRWCQKRKRRQKQAALYKLCEQGQVTPWVQAVEPAAKHRPALPIAGKSPLVRSRIDAQGSTRKDHGALLRQRLTQLMRAAQAHIRCRSRADDSDAQRAGSGAGRSGTTGRKQRFPGCEITGREKLGHTAVQRAGKASIQRRNMMPRHRRDRGSGSLDWCAGQSRLRKVR